MRFEKNSNFYFLNQNNLFIKKDFNIFYHISLIKKKHLNVEDIISIIILQLYNVY